MRRSALVRDRSLKNIFVSEAMRGQTGCERGYLVPPWVASASNGFPALGYSASSRVGCVSSHSMIQDARRGGGYACIL